MNKNQRRRKHAQRKQHNATAKERDREWKAKCLSRRDLHLAEMQRRELEGCNVKTEPPRTRSVLEQLIDNKILGTPMLNTGKWVSGADFIDGPTVFPRPGGFNPWADMVSGVLGHIDLDDLPFVDVEAAYPRTAEEFIEMHAMDPKENPRHEF